MKPAIVVENLSKLYHIGSRQHGRYRTLRETIAHTAAAPWRGAQRLLQRRAGNRDALERKSSPDSLWALRDVSFDVQPGEVVGIIGRNGAGKSTLLKIISRITEPASGRVRVRGRIGSLLEVGTGFHPELTGRENIYLNGAILGMSRREISRKFDEIVNFAEVDHFLDTPVKRYSSGMYVRLAFAVAAHLEPEILVVDEVLAVGDAQFQKKCLGKMREVGRGGRTVLFVSHNMSAVQSLCDKAIWLHQGQIQEIGNPPTLVARYLRTSEATLTQQVWDNLATAPGNDAVRLRRVALVPESGVDTPNIRTTTPLTVVFEYWNLKPGAYLNLSVHVFNGDGIIAFNTTSLTDTNWHGRPFPRGIFRSTCHIPAHLLNEGTYRLELMVVQDSAHVLYKLSDALIFDVKDDVRTDGWFGRYPGVVRPKLPWVTTALPAGASIRPDLCAQPE